MSDIERDLECNITMMPKFSGSSLLYKICFPIELEQKIKIFYN